METAAWLRDEWGVEAEFVRTDVTDKAQVLSMVDTAVERFGRLDVLVNNAWKGSGFARLENITDEQMSAGSNPMAAWAIRSTTSGRSPRSWPETPAAT